MTRNTGPSPADIETVRRLYGKPSRGTTVATFPVGLPVIVDGVTYKAPQTFTWAAGSTHTIEVADTVPEDDSTRYGFARWSDNGATRHTVAANADTPVFTASFVRYFKIAATVSPAGAGTVTMDPAPADGFFAQGSYVRILAVGATGRFFSRWDALESFPLSIPEEAGDIYNVNPRYFNVNKPKSFQASMVSTPNLVTIATEPANLVVELDGQPMIGPSRIAMLAGSAHTLTVKNPIQPSRGGLIEFHSRFVFTGWDGATSAATNLEFTVPPATGGPSIYTAKFKKQFQADVSIFGRGTVDLSPKPVDGFYDEGQLVKLTPQPAAGNRLFDWFGMPASLDALFNSDAPTNNVCASPLLHKMDRPILTSAQLTSPNTTGPKPLLTATAITSAASGAAGGVSPGEIVVLYGQNMGPKDLVPGNLSPGGYFDNCLGRMVVYFDGVPAPLLYGLAGQVSAIAPYSLAGKASTQVVVEYKDIRSDAVNVPVLQAKPAFFTANSSGKGPGAFLDLNYQSVSADNPVARASYAQLYATGGGQTNPGGEDGALTLDFTRLPKLTQPVRVFVGGTEAEVVYAGTAPGAVAGLVQVNVRIPESTPVGAAVPITLQIGTARSPDGVTIAIR